MILPRQKKSNGYYSNVSHGKSKKAKGGDSIPCILEPELTDKVFRRNWARLIQKIYAVVPHTCAKCQGSMRVIAFIELVKNMFDNPARRCYLNFNYHRNR